MGRQILFHALPGDVAELLRGIERQGPIAVIARSSDSPRVEVVPDPCVETQTMTLWNKALLGTLERELVTRPSGADYYRVNDSLPTLEFSPPRLVEWSGKPALLQGRLYGFFDKPSPGYAEWYDFVTRCVRRQFKKNPLKLLKGYVGPEAFKWFQDGGVLLPMFEPPPSSEWQAFVKGQHSCERTA